jgi:hypothetical protein
MIKTPPAPEGIFYPPHCKNGRSKVERKCDIIKRKPADLAIKIDLVDHPAVSCFLFNRDIDYSGGQSAGAFAEYLSIDHQLADQFKRHQAEHIFPSNFSLVFEPITASVQLNTSV